MRSPPHLLALAATVTLVASSVLGPIHGEHLAGELEAIPIIEDSWGYFALADLTYTF